MKRASIRVLFLCTGNSCRSQMAEGWALDVYRGQPVGYVISVCDRARRACPTWPAPHDKIDWSFDDPAEAKRTEEGRLEVCRRVALEIRRHIDLFLLTCLK